MLTVHAPAENGARKTEYPPGRAPYKNRRRRFNWRGTEQGRDALILMNAWIAKRVSVEALASDRKYAKRGINETNLADILDRMGVLTGLVNAYNAADLGGPFTPDLLMSRVYMWFLEHDAPGRGCHARVSEEHPLRWQDYDRFVYWSNRLSTVS